MGYDTGQEHDVDEGRGASEPGGIPRRRFLQAGAAAAAVAATGIHGASAFAGENGNNDAGNGEGGNGGGGGGFPGRPNFLFIMVDEQRYPVPYESKQLADWRAQYLRGQNMLMANGVSLTKH